MGSVWAGGEGSVNRLGCLNNTDALCSVKGKMIDVVRLLGNWHCVSGGRFNKERSQSECFLSCIGYNRRRFRDDCAT